MIDGRQVLHYNTLKSLTVNLINQVTVTEHADQQIETLPNTKSEPTSVSTSSPALKTLKGFKKFMALAKGDSIVVPIMQDSATSSSNHVTLNLTGEDTGTVEASPGMNVANTFKWSIDAATLKLVVTFADGMTASYGVISEGALSSVIVDQVDSNKLELASYNHVAKVSASPALDAASFAGTYVANMLNVTVTYDFFADGSGGIQTEDPEIPYWAWSWTVDTTTNSVVATRYFKGTLDNLEGPAHSVEEAKQCAAAQVPCIDYLVRTLKVISTDGNKMVVLRTMIHGMSQEKSYYSDLWTFSKK